jgi:hypothetical protein
MEIRVDRELQHTDALVVLAVAKNVDKNTVVVYKTIGKPQQLTSEIQGCPTPTNPHPLPNQSFKFIDKILKINDLLYGINFIFPMLDFNLSVKSWKNEQETVETVLSLSQPVKSVKFDPPLGISCYCDLLLSYSYDPDSFDIRVNPTELNLSKLFLPCYTVGIGSKPKTVYQLRERDIPPTAITINDGDVIINIVQ